jgi:hypothetical protein
MNWSEHLFNYCERGLNPAFWAEPFNAISNAGFIFASLLAAGAWAARPANRRGAIELLLVALVSLIGIGSFVFHTFATQWAATADVAPIGAFMVIYAGYALRRYLGWSWILVGLGLMGFAGGILLAIASPCPQALRGLVPGVGCFNGSVAYLPAFGMLLCIALLARRRIHPAANLLLASAAMSGLAIAVRSLDLEVCESTHVLGHARGTHAIWHAMNAVTLGLLLLTAIRHGKIDPSPPSCVEPIA